jgi:hypothetical protein
MKHKFRENVNTKKLELVNIMHFYFGVSAGTTQGMHKIRRM